MILAHAYAVSAWCIRAKRGVGRKIQVSTDGMRCLEEDEEMDILTKSMDERGHRYFNLHSRIGEFSWEIPLIRDPYEGPDENLRFLNKMNTTAEILAGTTLPSAMS